MTSLMLLPTSLRHIMPMKCHAKTLQMLETSVSVVQSQGLTTLGLLCSCRWRLRTMQYDRCLHRGTKTIPEHGSLYTAAHLLSLQRSLLARDCKRIEENRIA
jgi:hypothetical protein